ncbi:hypothetical protein JTB14_003836 [Gonioctena quinquepunctata]|nr:hypothetical protein JTB14_003836 [Gonioctena quinquepunctata]
MMVGNFETAAQCYIFLGKYEEAAAVLFRRSDIAIMEFAAELAEKSGNKELHKAVLFRYNAFKSVNDEKQEELLPLAPTKAEVVLEKTGQESAVKGVETELEVPFLEKQCTEGLVVENELETEKEEIKESSESSPEKLSTKAETVLENAEKENVLKKESVGEAETSESSQEKPGKKESSKDKEKENGQKTEAKEKEKNPENSPSKLIDETKECSEDTTRAENASECK